MDKSNFTITKFMKQSEPIKFKEMASLILVAPNSQNAVDRNEVSFHKLLTTSLRKKSIEVLVNLLKSELDKDFSITLKFTAKGIPSQAGLKPTGLISEFFPNDPSMAVKVYISASDITEI